MSSSALWEPSSQQCIRLFICCGYADNRWSAVSPIPDCTLTDRMFSGSDFSPSARVIRQHLVQGITACPAQPYKSFSCVLHATSKEFFRILVHEVDVAAIRAASQQNAVRVFRHLCKTVAEPLHYGVVGIRL